MKYIIMGLFSLLAVTTQAQVRGIVKDNTGEPVPGDAEAGDVSCS